MDSLRSTHSKPSSPPLETDHAGVIHDVNNMLCAILGMAELILGECPDIPQSTARAKTIIQVTERCMDLLSLLYTDTNDTGVFYRSMPLIPFVDDVVSWISYRTRGNTTIDVQHERYDLSVYSNATNLGSALMNLCLNALDSMPDGGTLRIRTGIFSSDGDNGNGNGDGGGTANGLFIEISDTGIGIPPAQLHHLFEPDFSTKAGPNVPHRGLGLYRTKHCIKSHGGNILVKSAPGTGTTFTIHLPFSPPPGREQAPGQTLNDKRRRRR